jgi:hypothetical protein
VFKTGKKSSYSDHHLCQFILVIRGLGTLLGRCEANLNIRRPQVGLSTLAKRIIQLHLDGISQSNVGPCALRVRHTHITSREAFERASREDEEVIDKEEDVGTIS